jgi:lipoprotein-anchoring transpeptidase ErfK/SrfK
VVGAGVAAACGEVEPVRLEPPPVAVQRGAERRVERSAEPPPPRDAEALAAPATAVPTYLVANDARVHAEATATSPVIGVLHAGTRVGVASLGPRAGDCRWLQLDPRGWVCTKAEPSALPPTGELPSLWAPGYDGRVFGDIDDAVVGTGHVLDDAPAVVRSAAPDITVDGQPFLRTGDGDIVPACAVPRYWGGEFSGVLLEPGVLPVGWTWSHEAWQQPTPVFAEPSPTAARVRELPPRSSFVVVAEQRDWVRIGDGEWLPRADVRIARDSEPPAELGSADAVWIDVSLAEQTLVLYRGRTPLRATLVSTGRPGFGTPTGVFHIASKTAVTHFDSPRPDLVEYHIDDVAWVMHINELYAVHGAWWNHRFGAPVSLGCVDVPAADIRAIYDTVEPRVPPGWWQVIATADHPGSIVRIRDP